MSRTIRTICLAALLTSLFLTGCATLPPPPVATQSDPIVDGTTAMPAPVESATPADLVDIEWNLVEIRPTGGATLQADGSPKYSVIFGADGRFGGQLDCNRLMGSYSVNGDALTLGPIASTMAFCQDDPIYTVYSAALNSVTTYQIVDNQLILTYAEGELVFLPNPMFTAVSPIGEGDLSNAIYPGIYDAPVQLSEGVYEGEPLVPGGASRPTVNLQTDTIALGDMNGDGIDDGAAVLVENSGGSGSFVYLAVLLAQNENGEGVTLLLGDRLRVESLTIEDGTVVLVAGTFAENDPLCCPSQRTRYTFALEDAGLVELSAEAL